MTDPQRIVEARMKLRERFLARAEAPPERPMGKGPPNRHGMPKLPIGQRQVEKWPVLDMAGPPRVPMDWRLRVDGEVEHPLGLSFEDLQSLQVVEEESDFHCVTAWSRMDLRFRGVRLVDVALLAGLTDRARHLMLHAHDGYTTDLSLEEALKPDVLLAWAVDGAPLPVEHGGPLRVITPQLYAWKGAKWVSRLEFLPSAQLGFWERNGYSDTARPWLDDRYS